MAGKKTIFIIDDDDIFILIAVANLKKNCSDVEIVTSSNGEDALKLLSSHRPDVLLLDINMPVMDGWEFLHELENLGDFKNCSVFITTSSVDPDDQRKAQKYALVKGFIEKPLSAEKIKSLNLC